MTKIRTMHLGDFDAVMVLMRATPGVTVREADSKEATARYLDRNPGMSFVAEVRGEIVGCVMCGHDGRRGYLQHLLVLPEFRRQGIARALVESCLEELERHHIAKVHIDVLRDNEVGQAFWKRHGWKLRTDINRYSFTRSGGANVY